MIVTVSIQNDAGRVRVGLQQCRCAYVNYLSISMQAPAHVITLWANNISQREKYTAVRTRMMP